MKKVLLQNDSTPEIKAVSQYCNTNSILMARDSIENVKNYPGYMPVGSVEFVTAYCHYHKIVIPPFDEYPLKYKMLKYIKRDCETYDVGEMQWLTLPVFIKPVRTKLFNGFVFHGFNHKYDRHDYDQIEILQFLPLGEELYASPVVEFVAEWRLYVINQKLVSVCRYDPNDDEYINEEKDMLEWAKGPIAESPYPTYCLDIGLLSDGTFEVVELNDAWAIGKYQGIGYQDYFKLLDTRWSEILSFNNSL
jgi:hypothetical protein